MTPPAPVSFREAVRVWAYIGVNSLGGPAGQISVMHREVVDQRRWVSDSRFVHALNYCLLLPGPEAQQLATYLGWLMHGVRGGVAAGALFILPGFVVMLGLSAVYAVFGTVTWVSGLLFGLQAAVVALVLQAMVRLARRTLHGPVLVCIAIASFLGLFVFGLPFPLVIALAAAAGWLLGRLWPDSIERVALPTGGESDVLLSDDMRVSPRDARNSRRAAVVALVLWLVPVIVLVVVLGTSNLYSQQALLFSKTAVITFGGAYAVLTYVAQQAVQNFHWLSMSDMATGLGLAETTPGPLLLVLEFVGFIAAYEHPGALPPLLAGLLGATLTVWVTFLPCFFFIFIGAPYIERLRHNVALRHALTGLGASVVGVIANLAVTFAIATAFRQVQMQSWGPFTLDVPVLSSVKLASLAISAVALLMVFRFRQPTLRILGVCAVLGLIPTLLGWT
jgi:chromate transporter